MQFAEETAIVSKAEEDYVLLDTHNSSTCSNCASKSGCGRISSILTFKPKSQLKINNTLNLKAGDSVVIAMASDKLLIATVLMYLSPILLLFIFSLSAKLLIGENASIIAGLLGLFSGLYGVKKITQNSVFTQQFEPKIIRKVINVELIK